MSVFGQVDRGASSTSVNSVNRHNTPRSPVVSAITAVTASAPTYKPMMSRAGMPKR